MFAKTKTAISGSFIGRFVACCKDKYKKEVELRLTSGYIAPVSRCLLLPTRIITAFWCWLQLGRVTLVNSKIGLCKERLIYCPNHSSYFDAIVMHSITMGPVHYMSAVEELRGLFGLKALFLTALGAFAVDRSKGRTVIAPAVDTLVSGKQLLMFPEGKIHISGKFGPFKPGAAVIAGRACEHLEAGTRVGIVPVHISYGKRDVETGSTYSFFKMGFSWRGGVKVFFGEPIWVNENHGLSADEIMEKVRQGMLKFPSETSGE